MISEPLSDYIPPQMNILKTFIPTSNALLQFLSQFEHYKPHKAACHLTKCDVFNGRQTISNSISQDILSKISDVIQSDVALQKQVH